MLPGDPGSAPSTPRSVEEQTTMVMDADEKISPLTFPVPSVSPEYVNIMASGLRSVGESVSETGGSITGAWAGLSECYTAPESETLHAVLDPVATDGEEVAGGMATAATALEAFAEDVQSIKNSWSALTTKAHDLLRRIEAEGEDWRKTKGWGTGDNELVAENKLLIKEAQDLVNEYAGYEVACANALSKGIPGRTVFEEKPEGGGDLNPNVFYHGYEQDLSELATEWGITGAGADHPWWIDAGAAVRDFTVGAVEGTGAMLGLHSSQGWFAQSWGDSIKEYHMDNIQSAASLVGLFDNETGEFGLASKESVKGAWKDLAHSVVPWEEWGDRPGYVIGTAVLNIGAMVGGAVLTATGVGAVVGVPLMAWRGAAILDGMGGSGRSGSGMDVDLPNLPDMPTFGGAGAPVVNIDTSQFTPAQVAELTASLDQLNASTGGSSNVGGGGSTTNDTTTGSAGSRSSQPASSSSEAEPNKPKKSATSQENPASTREEFAESERNLSDQGEGEAESTRGQQHSDNPEAAQSTPTAQDPNQFPTTGQVYTSDRALESVMGPEGVASFEAGAVAESNLHKGNQSYQDPNSPYRPDQTAARYGLDEGLDSTLADMRAQVSGHPEWRDNSGSDSGTGPDSGKVPVGAALGGNKPLEQSAGASSQQPIHADATGIDTPGSNNGLPGNEASGNNGTSSNGPNVQDRAPTATNKVDNPTSSKNSGPQDSPSPLRNSEDGASRSSRSGTDTATARRDSDGAGPVRGSSSPGNGSRIDSSTEPNRADRNDAETSSTRRDGDDSANDRASMQPVLGPDGPDTPAAHRGGDDSNARSSSEGSERGSTREEPVSVPKTRDEAQAKAYDILRNMDLGKGPEFVKNFVSLVNGNKYGALLERAFYNNLGYRSSADLEVNNQPVPSLTRASVADPWVARDSLPPPLPPHYLAGEIKGTRAGVATATLKKLDKFANLRQISLDAYNPLNKLVKMFKADHKANPGTDSSRALEVARENRRPMGRMKTRLTEMFGEKSAERAVRDAFTGSEVSFEEPLRDSKNKIVKDSNGNEVMRTWKGTLPELAESTRENPNPIPPSDNAPKNGNDQFDQIWRTKDGGFVIVEAKSSLGTELGERTVKTKNSELKRVSQGTREYFDDILNVMIKRGDPERALAKEIKRAMIEDEGKIHYVEARGKPGGSGDYQGNSMKFFDIARRNP